MKNNHDVERTKTCLEYFFFASRKIHYIDFTPRRSRGSSKRSRKKQPWNLEVEVEGEGELLAGNHEERTRIGVVEEHQQVVLVVHTVFCST